MINSARNHDRSFTVRYFEVEIGWINRLTFDRRVNDANQWRAMTRHGDVRHFPTFDLAKKFVVFNHR